LIAAASRDFCKRSTMSRQGKDCFSPKPITIPSVTTYITTQSDILSAATKWRQLGAFFVLSDTLIKYCST